MNKNKSRKNRVTFKKRSYKKINRTRKGGMFGIPKLFGFRGNKVQPEVQPEEQVVNLEPVIGEKIRFSHRLSNKPNIIYFPQKRIKSKQNIDNEQRQENFRKQRIKKTVSSPNNSVDIVNQSTTSQQPPTMLQYIAKPFLSWLDFFKSEPIDTQNNIKLCTPEKNGNNQNECTPDCVYQVANSPSTRDTIIGASLPYFSNFIIEYLNTKIRKNQIENSNDFLKLYNSSNQVNQSNYYKAFLNYLQNVKGFRINGNDGINILDKYFDESAFNNTNSITTFNRNDFFNFVREILPETAANELKLKKLRIDYTGKALARSTQLLVETSGEKYISYFTDNNVDQDNGTLCNEEKKWVLTCIRSRNNNYISVKEKGEWKLYYTPNDKIINELKQNNWSKYNLKKKHCGTCWICRQLIYHYYIIPTYTGDPNKMIYLNSKCGEDEHIFPPTVGDIIGTLNMEAKLVENVVTEFGTETLLAYGLRPSHAFCNQLKSDFLFIALLNINTGEESGDFHDGRIINDTYIKQKWEETVQKWFSQSRYNSFENIKSLFHNNATVYANSTLQNIKDYLDLTILKCLGTQLQISKIDISQLLKLKILIYIIQIGKNIIGEPFLEIWKKNMINE